MTHDDPPRNADLPRGYDEDDPYSDEALDTYPDWWRRNVAEFRAHGMRPYRPPRFRDGELSTSVITDLETKLSASVRIRSRNPQAGNDWEVLVDGDRAATFDRHREAEGFIVYEIDADEFAAAVRSTADENE